MRIKVALSLIYIVLAAGCSEKRPVDSMTDEQLRAFADELAHKFIIADGHVDFPERLKENKIVLTEETKSIVLTDIGGEFDYERSKKGGLNAPFMSIYIPASYQKQNDMGKPFADSLINNVKAIASLFPDKFALAHSPTEVEANFKAGKISLPLGMENGAPIGNDLANVKYFYDRGIRYITLTHNKDNQICDSSGDTSHTWNGLSPFGREVVAEMNRVGIMVDISHVDDSTFYQVMKLTKVPCIASHSSCRTFAPTVRRNMTDEMIKKLGENGGVMMINYYNAFIDSAVVNRNNANRKKLNALLTEKGLTLTDAQAKPIIEQFKKDNPSLKSDINMVVNHIDHVVQLAGIDHVGIGSDFDGVEGDLPTGLEDVSTYPNLIYTLLKRGYSEEDIAKICYRNIWRVWNKVEQVAKTS
ncbi:MAG: dipeptidase [Cyclobacteriaceae bacterium]|nr:dipeptidase [Cyclobacteriaceae bacterium]